MAAVAGGGAEVVEAAKLEDSSMDLSAAQADAVHKVKATVAALEATIEGLRAIGSVRGVQCIEAELAKERMRERQLVKESSRSRGSFLAVARG